MIKFACLLFSFISFFIFSTPPETNSFYLTSNIEHLFCHCLLAFPEIAFDKNNNMRNHYDIDCLTKNEFKNILEELYINNYALIDINETFETKNNVATKKKVKMPLGKKPLVLSFDDVNYDSKKLSKGMVDKIIIDTDQCLVSSTQINGRNIISKDNEFIPILEQFIKKHPDFSIRGAKGTINVTGYDGILGYRTSSSNTTNRQEEIEKVKPVIAKLKQNGWTFASHSYGHYHMKKITYDKFRQEVEKFDSEVTPLIGHTNIYVYPYGEWEVFEDGQKTNKHLLLEQYGFKLFCGVGMKTFFSYLPNKNGQKVLFMDRKVMDGNSLRTSKIYLEPFFCTENIYDYKNRFVSL